MSKSKRVEFLRHFNDYRMIAMFTMDTVVITIMTFLVCYSVFSIGGASLIFIVFGSLIITSIILYVYVKAKRSTSKGFLKHWLFNREILRLKYDEERWEELKHSDSKSYFPNGGDKFFAD